jgi:hypothetical protein
MSGGEGPKEGCQEGGPEVKKVVERIEVGLEDLVSKLKELAGKGIAQRVVVQNDKGEIILNVPLFVGAAAGVASIAYAPIISAIVATVGLLKSYKIIIETKPASPASE